LALSVFFAGDFVAFAGVAAVMCVNLMMMMMMMCEFEDASSSLTTQAV
jgi:hypothetical protein